MENLVQDAVTRGAKLLTGGKRSGQVGFLWEPTILTDVPEDSEIMLVELFLPLVPIIDFDSLEEVILKASSLPYGLAAYVFTRLEKTTEMLDESLELRGIAVKSH